MEVTYFFLDDSGSLADLHDPVVIVAVLAVRDLHPFRSITHRAWRKYTRRKGKRRPISEFKFHEVEKCDIVQVLTALSKAGAELSVLVVNKEAQQIPDTSENYGLLMAEALEMSLAYHPSAEARVVWDRHFSQWQKQERLANLVSLALSFSSFPADANSKSNTLVQLADFVAGAYHRKHRTGDATLAAIVASSVVEERIVQWKDLKRKWLHKLGNKKW